MSLTATFRAFEADDRPRRDLRLVPALAAAYLGAWFGDGQATYAALLIWAACAVLGAALLVAGRVRAPRSTAAPHAAHEVAPADEIASADDRPATGSATGPSTRADPRTSTQTGNRTTAGTDPRTTNHPTAGTTARTAARTTNRPTAGTTAQTAAGTTARTTSRPTAGTTARPTNFPTAGTTARTPTGSTTRADRRNRPHPTTRTTTRRRALAAAFLVAAGAGAAATTRAIATHTGPLPRLAAVHAQVAVDAVLTDDPRVIASRHGPFAVVPVRVERVNGLPVRLPATVLASRPDAWRLLPSTRVHLTGRLRPPRPDSPDAAALSVRRPPQILAGPSALQTFAGRLRQGLRDACAHLPADPRGLLPGLVIGDVSQEPDSLTAAFHVTGLSHLTAVSGENLAFLLAAAMPVARLAGLRGRFLTLAGITVVVAFTVVARPEPSMVRASVMALLSLLLAAVGRRARGVPLLCAGGTLLLLFDPWLARSYGFALSLSATAGIFLLAPGWQRALAERGLPHRIAESLACTAAAEACCLPVLVSLTAEITPLAIPANLLAEVFVGPATVLGAAALLASAVWLPLGRAVAWLAQWPTDGIVVVARAGARLPGATVSWPGGLAGSATVLAAYAVLFLILTAVASRKEAR